MKSVIVGTAGHIDHGKTTLVKALTGIDADRLEEEKRRGITIDLGFANLELTSDQGEKLRLGFVDVPGHERFVRNMLAGVGGIDIVLLVIAADEGVKPQTREHFDICRLLAIPRGIVVLTKSDTVDTDTLEVVRLEIEDFLRGSFLDPKQTPIVPVSALTGQGTDQLKIELARMASEIGMKNASALARLPIDRAFVMRGFGAVITGTLIAGTIKREQELELHPSGKRVRVRGMQVHGRSTEQARAGERTAVNLAGIAFWLESTVSSAISAPRMSLTAKAGTVAITGRRKTPPRAIVNSSLLAGLGAARFTGPLNERSFMQCKMAPTSSSMVIQLIHWRPLPIFPPSPKRNGVRIMASAPPFALRTIPVRRLTTRIPPSAASLVAFSQSRATSARNPVPTPLSSVSISSPRLP